MFFVLLFGTGVLAFWQLGALPLIDVDEPVYGEVGKELARLSVSRWLTPLYDGQPWFDKPPLFYWLVALSMRAFGVSEFAARLPSALMSVVLVAATYALARRAYPHTPQVGLWAGFSLATSLQFFMLARACVTDMTLAACLTLALFALYAWTTTNQARWALLAGVMTGLAVLTKGPAFLILIGAQAMLYLCLTRQAKRLLSPVLWAGFIVSLLVSIPWFALMIHQHGQQFIQGFLEANNVTRYLKAEHQSTQAFWFFIPVFLGLFFPWTLALLFAPRSMWQRIKEEHRHPSQPAPTIFLALWFALVFVFFSASQSKLITYIFPLYPAAAILVASHLTQRSRWQWAVPGVATGLALLITWCLPVWKTREGDISERLLARTASEATPPGGMIYALGLKKPSLRYYATRPVVFSDDHAQAKADMARHSGHVYAMRPEDLDAMRPQVSAQDYTILQAQRRTILVQATPPATQKTPAHDTTPTP